MQERQKHKNTCCRSTVHSKGYAGCPLLLVVRPVATSSVLAPSSDALVPSSFLLVVVRPGATSSVLAPSSDALCSQ